MSQQQANQSSADEENLESSVVAALYGSAQRILKRYQQQLDTQKQIVKAEWELTLKSLWLALVFIIVFMSVVVVTWFAINATLAYMLYSIATPVWGIGLVIIVMHVLAIFVLLRTIRGLFSEVGFKRTLAAFNEDKTNEQGASETDLSTQHGGE